MFLWQIDFKLGDSVRAGSISVADTFQKIKIVGLIKKIVKARNSNL